MYAKIVVALIWAATLIDGAYGQPDERYPSRLITIVVPMAAGGTTDILARAMAPSVSTLLGQTIVIENRPGANGAIGEEFVSRSNPDGYTVMLESTSIATNPWVYPQKYDPRQAFTAVIQLAAVPLALAVNSKVEAKSAAEFVELARGKPDQLSYSSWGNGSIGQFAGEIFKLSSRTSITHVPYRSTAQALNDTLAGHVNAMFLTLPLVLQHLKSGRIRALAVTSKVRSPMAPEIPTMAEAGLPGVEVETWFGIFVRSGTPDLIVERLHDAFARALAVPAVKSNLEDQGFRLVGGSTEDFAQFYRSEIDRYERVAQQAGIKSDN